LSGRKLTPEAEKRILELAKRGRSKREIAADIQGQLGISISYASVSRFLSKTKKAQAGSVKSAAAAPEFSADLAKLDVEISRLAKMAKALGVPLQKGTAKPGDFKRYMQILDRQAKLTRVKLQYSGANAPEVTGSESVSEENVLNKIASLVAATVASAPIEISSEAPPGSIVRPGDTIVLNTSPTRPNLQ